MPAVKALLYLLIFIFTAFCAAAFTVLNPGEIEVNLFFARYHLPFPVVIILSMFFGVLLGFLAGMIQAFSKAREVRRIKRQLRDAQTELSNLRKLPIEEP